MKIALLGSTDESVGLARTIAAQGAHQLVAAYCVTAHRGELHDVAPGAVWSDQWESVLHGTVADAVILANDSFEDSRVEQLRKLVQAGIPLLAFHPCCEAIVAFELDMIRRDTACPLVPYIPGRQHPVLAAAQSRAGSAAFGAVEQLVVERMAAQRSREVVLTALARDINLVTSLAPDVQRVSAMDTIGDLTALTNLSVNMTAAENVLVRWSIGPGEPPAASRIVVRSSEHELVMTLPASLNAWTVESDGKQMPVDRFSIEDDHQQILASLERAVQGQAPELTWSEVCRDLEVVSAIEQSVRRGRTIEIFPEEYSEEQTFKGIMAIGSCGMLMAAFLFLIGLAVFEGLRLPLRDAAPGDVPQAAENPRAPLLLRLWPFYPFAAFLLLQLLRLVFRADRSRESDTSDS